MSLQPGVTAHHQNITVAALQIAENQVSASVIGCCDPAPVPEAREKVLDPVALLVELTVVSGRLLSSSPRRNEGLDHLDFKFVAEPVGVTTPVGTYPLSASRTLAGGGPSIAPMRPSPRSSDPAMERTSLAAPARRLRCAASSSVRLWFARWRAAACGF